MSKLRIETVDGAIEVALQSHVAQLDPGQVMVDASADDMQVASADALADLRTLAKLGIAELDEADEFCWGAGYDAGDPDNNAVRGLADVLKLHDATVIG